jgi:IclR family acetate operon transcriptional repressor
MTSDEGSRLRRLPVSTGRANRTADVVQPRIQSLARANDILDVVLKARTGTARLAEISTALRLNKTTVFNLAESLVAVGFLTRATDQRGYRLGLRNLELGRVVVRRNEIIELCRPTLMRLCRETMETVNLAVPYLTNAMILESYEGSHGVRPTSYSGTPAPYHATACGKALLAHMAQPVREEIYRASGLRALTPNTITDRAKLEADLAEARKRGHAVETEECEIGASCVAMAVRDGFDEVCAAISVAGFAQRMTPASVERIVLMLSAEVAGINQRLRAE